MAVIEASSHSHAQPHASQHADSRIVPVAVSVGTITVAVPTVRDEDWCWIGNVHQIGRAHV